MSFRLAPGMWRHGDCRRLCFGLAVGVWLALVCGSPCARAARVVVGAETEVRSIRFSGVHHVQESRLRGLLETPTRGSAWRLRTWLAVLPLVSPPSIQPFDPLVLQEDVVRMRNYYAASGFLGTRVRYEVRAVAEDLLEITFVIDEGAQLEIGDVSILPLDSTGVLPVPERRRDDWNRVVRESRRMIGDRLDAGDILGERKRIESWWRDNGFARASVMSYAERDSLRRRGQVRYVVDAGTLNTYGPIAVEGNQSISDHVVRRELPFETGDTYSQRAMQESRRDIQQLQIVRLSRVEVVPSADGDSSAGVLPVKVTISESKPHVIAGEIGYGTDGGISTEAQWSHLNFAGDARVLTVTGLSQTGLLALNDDPDERYRGVVSLQQPHVFHRRVTALVSPFVEHRQDYTDRSLEVGSNFTLVYRVNRLLSASIDYRISSRKIYEYRLGELVLGDVDLLTFLARLADGGADAGEPRVKSSLFTLAATAGTLDDVANPRRGVLVKPSLQVTAPASFSSANYSRADGTLYGFVPLARRFTFAARFTAGRLFPFGASVPEPGESPTLSALALRDVSFTAGGSTDVRGWGYRLLGPKFPDVRYVAQGDTLALTTRGYVPIGGLSRMSFTAEMRMPLPPLGPRFGSHVFLDGGRVWTADDRFNTDDPVDEERMVYAAGFGLDILTPVGSIRVSMGYKLNPSDLDLIDSGDLLPALLDGTSTDGLERHDSQRWQFNLSIGTSY